MQVLSLMHCKQSKTMMTMYQSVSEEHIVSIGYNILKEKFNELIRKQLCKEGISPMLLPRDYGSTTLPNTYAEHL